MHEAERKRNEESVQKGSAKITELDERLKIAPHGEFRYQPSPRTSKMLDQLLDELCDAHRPAVESVKARESEVSRQGEERADELRAKHEGLDEREEKPREREQKLKEAEEKLKGGVRELRKGRRS